MSTDVPDVERLTEALDDLTEVVRSMGRSFDVLAKRQTILFQQVQDLKEITERPNPEQA